MCVSNHSFRRIQLVVLTVIFGLVGNIVFAQTIFEDEKIFASDGVPGDRFGWSVDIDGDRAVVGNLAGKGAYVFRFDGTTWVEQQKLEKPLHNLGSAVAIDGDKAIVGSSSGAAVIFRFDGSTWIEEQKLLVSGVSSLGSIEFGWSVDIKGDIAIVGARRGDGNVNDSGTAHVYRFDSLTSTWVEEATIYAADGAVDDFFGTSVAINGDFAVVGARGDNPPAGGVVNWGSAYVFHFDGLTWVERQKLTAIENDAADRWFGISVDINGEWIISGAWGDFEKGSSAGAAYLYRFDGVSWNFAQKLFPSTPVFRAEFGSSVAIDGNLIAVGQGYLGSGNQAYVFHFDGATWMEQHKLIPSDTTSNFGATQHGHAVGISGNRVIGGAYADPVGGVEIGAAYIYTVTPPGPVYSCVGFEQPVGSEPITVRRKRAIPLKAQLLDMDGIPVTSDNISAQPVLQILFSSQTGDDPIDVTADALAVGLGTEGNQFVFEDERWRYNLKTTVFTAPGTYVISMVSGDQYNIAPTCQGTFVINE